MRRTVTLGISCFFAASFMLATSLAAFGQDTPARHGRKYKPPPETSHIEVLVIKKSTGKPVPNAAVVFNPSKDGKDEGSLELKTDPDGKATVDVIPTGSLVRVQIIANGFATFAEDYQVNEPSRQISVQLLSPRAQVSTYTDNDGKASQRKVGVQDDPETAQREKAKNNAKPSSPVSESGSTNPPTRSTEPAPAADGQKQQ